MLDRFHGSRILRFSVSLRAPRLPFHVGKRASQLVSMCPDALCNPQQVFTVDK